VRVAGDSMTGAVIFSGDIAVVNRAREAIDGCIVELPPKLNLDHSGAVFPEKNRKHRAAA
jgi:hypothetical protein